MAYFRENHCVLLMLLFLWVGCGEELPISHIESHSAELLLSGELPVVVVKLNDGVRPSNPAPLGKLPRELLFGNTDPSVTRYLSTVSGGRFSLKDAGVFVATVSTDLDTRAGVTMADSEIQKQIRRTVQVLVDNACATAPPGTPCFDWNKADANGDTEITDREMTIVAIENDHCWGINRNAGDYGVTFPNTEQFGKTINPSIAFVGDNSKFMNYVHELAHNLGMADRYSVSSNNVTWCNGQNLTWGSCTALLGSTNGSIGGTDCRDFGAQDERYYPDPADRERLGWLRGAYYSSAASGTALLAPVSRAIPRSSSAFGELFLMKGNENFVFELRRPDGAYDNDVPVDGVVAWYVRKDSNGNPLSVVHVTPEDCHLDELTGRAHSERLLPGKSYFLRSSKQPWNVRVTVGTANAQGELPVTWTTVPNGDDNRCRGLGRTATSFVASPSPSSLALPRLPRNGNPMKSAQYTDASGWTAATLPTRAGIVGHTLTVSDTSGVHVLARDSNGQLLTIRRTGSAWGTWSVIAGVGEVHNEFTAVNRGPTLVDVFWIRNDGVMRHQFFRNGAWSSSAVDVPSPYSFRPAFITAIAPHEFNFHVFAHVTDAFGLTHVVDHEWRAHTGWEAAGVAVVATDPQGSHVAAASSNRYRTLLMTQTGAAWRVAALLEDSASGLRAFEETAGPTLTVRRDVKPSLIARVPGHYNFYAVSPDGSIITSFADEYGSWSSREVLTPPNAALAQGMADVQIGAVARGNASIDVFAADRAGSLHQAFWRGGGWGTFFLPY